MAPRIAVVELVVSDMARSVAFYRHLGLEFPEEAAAEPHVEATLPGGLRLALDTEGTIRSFDPDWTAPTGGHRAALAFEVDGPAEVDRLHGDLVAAGATSHLAPWDAPWGMRYAVVHDPDGATVDLFARLPAAG